MILILSLLACLNSNKVKRLNVPSEEGVIALCPGEVLPLKVNVKMRNGKRKSTTASGRAHLNWKHLEMRLDGQPMAGSVSMPLDPKLTWQRPLSLKVWLADRPEVIWEGQVVARYDCDYVVDLRGYDGAAGQSASRDGEDGLVGEDGGDRGEPGNRGQAGGAGAHGGHGNMGPQATVSLVKSTNAEGLLEAQVTLANSPERWIYLMAPGASTLLMDVSGGNGGWGQAGGQGGDGGDGGDGLKQDGPGGDGGEGGEGGDGGDGGQGGSAELIVDPNAEAWSSSITLRAEGGAGGQAGKGGAGGDGGYGAPSGDDGIDGRAGREGAQGPRGETLPVRVTTVTPSF